jgi:hypothetical protein
MVAHGVAAQTEGAAAARASKGGKRPQVGRHGPEWTASWANTEKILRKMQTGGRRGLGRNADWASEQISELISRILSSNQKV